MKPLFLAIAILWGAANLAAAAESSPPPPAPHQLPALSAYGKLPAIDLVRLSPSGEKIAFVAVAGDSRRLFVRKVSGDAVITVPVGTTKVRDLLWAGENYVLALISTTGKFGDKRIDSSTQITRAEIYNAIVINLTTGSVRQLLNNNSKMVLFGAIYSLYRGQKIDGRWYAFLHGYSDALKLNIIRADLENDDYTNLTQSVSDDIHYALGADGNVSAHTRYDQDPGVWNLFVGKTGNQLIAKRESPTYTTRMDGIGRAENTILIQDTKLGRDTLDEYVLKADAIPTSLFEGRTVETLLRDPVNDLLIGATTDSDQTGIFFDPKLQRRYDAAKKAFVGYHVILESYSENLSKIAIETDGVDDAGTHWLVDMITGKADELTVDYPGITSADVGPTRMFSYRADDGLDLEGLLTLPPRTHRPNLPLVVIVNDGPIGECVRPGFYYHAQAFASRGYAVFQPNYRGSCGYGAAFRERGMGEWGRKILTDISGGVEALAKTGLVDRDRVCIVGSGYGGYAALAGVTVQKGLYKCAVSRGGISDVGIWMARKVQGRDAGANRYYQQLLGVKFAGDKALERISPARQAANADAPIMLIHGKDDSQVPYAQSLNMSLALKAAHKPFEFVSLEDEDHWMSREATRVQALEAYLAFVQKYNPVELPSAADR